MRHARRGCRMAHQTRRMMKVLAKVKLTTSQTTPRTASQLTSATTMIQYQASCCPASSMKVSTAATVRLGSRSGLIKSIMRQYHFRSVFGFNMRSSRCCRWSGRSMFYDLLDTSSSRLPKNGEEWEHPTQERCPCVPCLSLMYNG